MSSSGKIALGSDPSRTKRAPVSVKRILIVEDDRESLDTLQEWLAGQGWHVRVAETGMDAIRTAASFQPHVVVTDYLLQDEITGIELIVRLRASGLHIRYVLVTAVLGKALLEGVKRLNGVPLLAKPFDFQRLLDLIRR